MNVGDFVVTIEVTVKTVDKWLHMWNHPLSATTVDLAEAIDIVQRQVRPQVDHVKTNIETVKSATEKMNEPKTTSKK
jgi:hypothetical protein